MNFYFAYLESFLSEAEVHEGENQRNDKIEVVSKRKLEVLQPNGV